MAAYFGYCDKHSKQLFTRKQARCAAREMHDPGLREYRCGVVAGLWHIGHLPQATKAGRKSASEIYGGQQ